MKKLKFTFIFFFCASFCYAQFVLPSTKSIEKKQSLVYDLDINNINSYAGSGNTKVYNINNSTNQLDYSSIFPIAGVPSYNTSLRNLNVKYLTFNAANSQYIITPGLKNKFNAINGSTFSNAFTINIWISFPTTTSNGIILGELGTSQINTNWHDAQIEIQNGTLYFNLWPYTNTSINISNKIQPNVWYMLSMVYDGQNLKAFIDGNQVGNTSSFARNAPYNYGNDLYYCLACQDGTYLNAGGYGNFNLVKFQLYNIPLNANDLIGLYNNQKASIPSLFSPNVASYWYATSVWDNNAFNSPDQNNSSYYHYTPWIDSQQGWSPGSTNLTDYIYIKLDFAKNVTGIVTQGRVNAAQWVTQGKVEYSLNGTNWYLINTFNMNSDQNTKVYNYFSSPVYAQYIRVTPTLYSGFPSMRLGLLY